MSAAELASRAASGVMTALSTTPGIIAVLSALVAAALTVIASFVQTMIPLRWLAVGGNLGFVVYGALYPSFVVFGLHAALLPINLYRALEMVRLTRRVTQAATSGDLSGVWLKPYMRRRRLKAGEVLFRKGDLASHLFFLAEGRIEFVEIKDALEAGRIFGEIAFFAPDKRRTLTARCAVDSTVLSIDESTFRQLYFQNPAFGFEVVSLVAGRLMADLKRLEDRLAERPAAAVLDR